jgi:hypothetical protein
MMGTGGGRVCVRVRGGHTTLMTLDDNGARMTVTNDDRKVTER